MSEPKRNLSWADLFSQGSLCDLDVKVWAALAAVKPADLGITHTDEVKKGLTFGHERLIAKAKLEPIRDLEGEARRLVEANSIAFKLIPGSCFIPKSRRDALEEGLNVIREKFNKQVEKFIDEYEANRREQIPVLRKALEDSARNPEAVGPAIDRLISLYPGQGMLGNLFGINWKLFSIAAPIDGSGDSQEAQSVRDAVGDMIQKLRDEIDLRTKDIIDLVTRGGKLTLKTFNSATALCDRLEGLNVFGDPGLAVVIGKLREILARARGQENAGDVLVSGLKGVSEELKASKDKALEEVANRLLVKGQRKLIA